MKNYLKNLILPNDLHLNQYKLRRVILLNALLFIAVVVMVIFGILNIFKFNEALVGSIDIIGAFIALIALIDYQINSNIHRASLLGTLNLFIFFLSFALVNQNDNFGLIWTIFFPIFAITLNGHKQGLRYTIIYYILLFIMTYSGINVWQGGEWSFVSFIRHAIASIVLVYVVYINELAQYRANEIIIEKEKAEQKNTEKLERLSMTDSLTQLFNRRKIDEVLEMEINRATRYKRDLSITIFDIDDFKKINDTHGHIVGDKVLIELSSLILNSIRKSDYLGRWGGEEFIIIFTETSLSQATLLTEKLRQLINNHKFTSVGNLTCSFGLAHYYENDTITTIVNNADKALYSAKHSGKNVVKVFHESGITN